MMIKLTVFRYLILLRYLASSHSTEVVELLNHRTKRASSTNGDAVAQELENVLKDIRLIEDSLAKCDTKEVPSEPLLDDEFLHLACNPRELKARWFVILRRQDGKTNFYRPWSHYKNGFGSKDAEFFIGLQNLYYLTICAKQELLIEMRDANGTSKHAKYDRIEIGSEQEFYNIKQLGNYTGDAGNSLERHLGLNFSTFDRDNDDDTNRNCARYYRGAGWYFHCHDVNLFGEYGNDIYGQAISWKSFNGQTNGLKHVEMKIRPKLE